MKISLSIDQIQGLFGFDDMTAPPPLQPLHDYQTEMLEQLLSEARRRNRVADGAEMECTREPGTLTLSLALT